MTWTAVNQGRLPLPTLDHSADSPQPEISTSQASKHRDAILKAAAKVAARWTRPALKRKKSLVPDIGIKKPKLKDTDPSHSDALSERRLRLRKKSHVDQQKKLLKITKSDISSSANSEELNFDQDACQTSNPIASEPRATVLEENKRIGTATSERDDATLYEQKDTDDFFADLDDSYFDDLGQCNEDEVSPSLSRSITGSDCSSSGPPTPMSSVSLGHLPLRWPMLPFLRTAPPDVLPSIKQSPMPSLAGALKIQTCFRVAEAVRLLKAARRSGTRITVELFAIATELPGDKGALDFRFADAFFPDRAPYINGRCERTVHRPWADNDAGQLHSLTSLRFNSNTYCKNAPNPTRQIVRAILKHPLPFSLVNGNSANSGVPIGYPTAANTFYVMVEDIRESCWDEIKHVRGIVDSEGVESERRSREG